MTGQTHTVWDANGVPRTGPNGCDYCALGPGMHHPDAWDTRHPDRLRGMHPDQPPNTTDR